LLAAYETGGDLFEWRGRERPAALGEGMNDLGELMPSFDPNTSLGHYRIEERIGIGGMGVVYKAVDTKLNRSVALKVVRPELLQDDGRKRLEREARALASLNHPHVAAIHGLEESREASFLVLEYVPGPTLAYLRNNMCWFVRTANEPLGVAAAVREEVRKIDADVPATSTRTLEQYLAQAVAPRQFNLMVVGFFGVAALLLATLGIYAVISYSVAQRTGEIGLRIALGAQRGEVFRLITGQGIRVVATGVIAGIVPAMALTGLMKSMLFGVSVMDPQIYAGIVALLLVVALLACYLPGRRAMSVDPVTALRSE